MIGDPVARRRVFLFLLLTILPGGLLCAADGNAPRAALPESARTFSIQAERAFSAGHLPEAKALYEKALRIAPENPALLVSLAAVETRLGNLGGSDTLLRRALRSDLRNGPAWLLLGINALEQKHDDEAFASLAQAVFCSDGNPRAHNYLGIAAGRKGWNEASEQELRKAVELDPGYAVANFNLAVLYIGRTPPLVELARRHYQRALDLGSPRDPAVEARLGNSPAKSGGTP